MTPDTSHLTLDTWHLTPDTWHLTPDMWHLVGDEHPLKISRLLLSLFGRDCALKIFFHKPSLSELMNEWMNELINYEAVCRTAPATPGLLIMSCSIIFFFYKIYYMVRPTQFGLTFFWLPFLSPVHLCLPTLCPCKKVN